MMALGYYGADRKFRCAACGPTGLTPPVETVEVGDNLDYAMDECSACGKWVDEDEG